MFEPSVPHLLILLAILLVVFGARRLPEIGKGLGSGIKEFKDSASGSSHEPPVPPPPEAAASHPQPTRNQPAATGSIHHSEQ